MGATVTGAIATNVRQNLLQVPARAVTTNNGASTVTVATNGKLSGPTETRVVQTGVTSGGMVEITSGLEEGDSVIETVPQFTATGGTAPAGGGLTGRNGTGANFGGGGRRTVVGGG